MENCYDDLLDRRSYEVRRIMKQTGGDERRNRNAAIGRRKDIDEGEMKYRGVRMLSSLVLCYCSRNLE